MVCGGKKGCPRERNLREIYTENNVGKTALLFCILETHYNVLSFVSFLCCFYLHITEYKKIRRRGGAKFSWAQGRKIPKYGPAIVSLH
jgi:DMSO/TMAO reductase YedYZ heme-binding membrane subunit